MLRRQNHLALTIFAPRYYSTPAGKRRGFGKKEEPSFEEEDTSIVSHEGFRHEVPKPSVKREEPQEEIEVQRPMSAIERRMELEAAREQVRLIRMRTRPEAYEPEEWQPVDHSITLEMAVTAMALFGFICFLIFMYFFIIWEMLDVYWFFAWGD